MKISHQKTNHVLNPLGYAIDKPRFSWIVEDTPDTVKTAAQVLVSHDHDFAQVLFDSGRIEVKTIDNLAYRPQISLLPYTRYSWKVRIWGESERAESEAAWIETAKMDDDWLAEWITPDWESTQTLPGFRAARIAPKPDRSLQWARVLPLGGGLLRERLALRGARTADPRNRHPVQHVVAASAAVRAD